MQIENTLQTFEDLQQITEDEKFFLMDSFKAPLCYTAAPYTILDANGVEDFAAVDARMQKFFECENKLANLGYDTVSPLYKHTIRKIGKELEGDWNRWGSYSEQLLSRCDYLLVLTFDGWDRSTGVLAEIEEAKKNDISIFYVDPDKLMSM